MFGVQSGGNYPLTPQDKRSMLVPRPPEGVEMGAVKIKCPTTGKAVSTGIAMDRASFESSQMSDNKFKCPACGQMHAWDKKDAWVEESE
jgi:predicted RNA-binding Zn-ribbon protein involved in translation (DUF1610 family)